MYEILVPALVFVSVVFIGGAIVTGQMAKKKRIRDRLEGVEPVEQPVQTDQAGRILGVFDKIGRAVSSGRPSVTLRETLAAAGFHDLSAPGIFIGIKLALLVAGLVALAIVLLPTRLFFPAKMLLIAMGGGVLFLGPNLFLRLLVQRRRQDIVRHLPDAIDLLEVSVSSGMGLDMAWNLVAAEIRDVSSNLADEMALADLEIHLGASRIDAMRHMADRTKVQGLWSLAAVLAQSERFGTSIGETLRTFAASMREQRSARAEEWAEKMAVKLLFPMMLLIFPAILVVLAGPAAIQMADKLLFVK